MDKETGKPWERPWTTDEIREHSSNWNLAGDSGLLHHLQQFSQNLLAKTHSTEVALDKFADDLKAASNEVQNATNTFLFLANTQFVENRVYDDDEKETPPEEKKDDVVPPKSKEELEAEVFQNVKKALDMGLALLDTHFEAVEVPGSDSEEEEESTASVGRLVLKTKNPYLSRPLPYLIGSKEFMEDDKVGLGEISSDTEESPDQNVVQSSESDDEMEHDDLLSSSKRPMTLSSSDAENSEPESDRSGAVTKKKMRASSSGEAVDAEEEESDIFGRASPPEADDVAFTKGGLKNTFSDELSSKLVAANPQASSKKEKEKENLFVPSSEPEDDAGLFGNPSRSSDKQGLFDDLDDWKSTSDSLWSDAGSSSTKPATNSLQKDSLGKKKTDASHIADNFVDNQDDLFTTSKKKQNDPLSVDKKGIMKESTPKSFSASKAEGAFFGQSEESDDLFSQEPKKAKKVTGAAKSNSDLFGKDELEEDDLFAIPSSSNSKPATTQNGAIKKKPVGGVLGFSDVDLFGDSSPIVRPKSAEERNPVGRNEPAENASQDHSSGFGNGSYDQAAQRENLESKERIPSEISSINGSQFFQGAVTSTKIADFDASDSSLFRTEVNSDSLFDREGYSWTGAGTLDRNIFGYKTVASGSTAASSSLKSKLKKPGSLFDDSDSGDDELLFSSTSSTSSRSRRSQGSGDFLGSAGERKILPRKGLFEDNLLFGASSKDEPEVDIFSSQSDSKTKGNLLGKENLFSGNDVPVDSSANNKKVTSSIFDDVDEVDDIFAVPKITLEKSQGHSSKNQEADLGKLSLFSDDLGKGNDIFSSEANESKTFLEFTSTKEERTQPIAPDNSNDINERPNEHIGDSSLFIDNSPSHSHVVDKQEEVIKNTKPVISQKPKVPIKPVPSSSLPSLPSKSERNVVSNENISVNDRKSEDTEKLNNDTVSDQEQESSNNIEDKNVSENVTTVSSLKPEPPRTLNIRKTTDIVFESPSNDDDIFGSSWSNNSLSGKEKIAKEKPISNILESSNLSNVLEGLNSVSNSDLTSKVLKKPNSTSESVNKKLVTVGISPSETVEQQTSMSSPSKLFIDPRALLPGARHPGKPVAADRAVGFDKPAETTSTLHSAAKERVKIQVKRRPQTRRARQEALRASSIEYDNIDAALISQISDSKNDNLQNDVEPSSASSSSPLNAVAPKVFEPDSGNKSPVIEKSVHNASEKSPKNNSEDQSSVSESEQLLSKNDAFKNVLSECLSGNSNALSPLTDEEDLFAVPHDLPFDESSNKEMPNDSRNLFGGAPVLSPLEDEKGSGSFGSESVLQEREPDNSLLRKETSDSLGAVDSTKNNGDTTEGPLRSDISKPATPRDKSSKSVSLILDTETKPSGNDWLVQNDLEGVNEDRGLFDNENDNDDESDDDLFSSVKKPNKFGKKSKKDASSEASRAPLFSPTDNTLENILKKNEQKLQSHNEEFVSTSTEVKESTQDESDIFFSSSKTVIKSISSNQRGDKNSELFSENITDSSQIIENDDLFSSNVSPKDTKTDSTAKTTRKPVPGPSQEKTKSRIESLFGDDSIESDDLFGSSSVPKMTVSGVSRNSIAGSKSKDIKGLLFDDGDDDIFTLGLKTKESNRGPKSEPLFSKEGSSQGAEKDDDDLFSKRNTISKNQGAKHSSTQKVQSFEDPLLGFNK